MKVKALGGKSTGTNIIAVPSTIMGGVLITADGTNDAVVMIKKAPDGVASSDVIFELSTKTSMFICAPFASYLLLNKSLFRVRTELIKYAK